MLFKLINGKDFFELNPGARAIEEFNACTSRQMWFVALTADVDWDNPLRTLPEEERRYHAAMTAGYKMEGNRPDKNAREIIAGKSKTAEAAIRKYLEIQYDEENANLAAMNRQIQEVREILTFDKIKACTEGNVVDLERVTKLAQDAVKLGTNLAALIEQRDALRARITSREPSVPELATFAGVSFESDPNTSLVDQLMSKKND